MEFIDLEDPRIKISNQLKNRFQEMEGELSLSPITQSNISSTEDHFKLAKSQYFTKDDKFEQCLKLELNKIGKYEICYDDMKNAFFSIACDFPEKISTDDFRNALSILNLEDKSCLEYARYYLQNKQK